jgi:hypothetical protein
MTLSIVAMVIPPKKHEIEVEFSRLKVREIYMKESRFTDNTIMAIFKHAEASGTVPDNICREHGMSSIAL